MFDLMDILLHEFENVDNYVQSLVVESATVFVGTIINPGMMGEMRVTVIAGLGKLDGAMK